MSKYKISQVGPMDAWENLAGVAPGKSFVEGDLGAEFVGISVNNTKPGDASPFWHTHSKIEEIYIFLEGDGEMALEDEVVPVTTGTIIRVPQGVWRALRCLPDSETDLKWLCLRGGEGGLAEIGNDAEIDKERPFPW